MKRYKIWWQKQEYIVESDKYLHAKQKLCRDLGLSIPDTNKLIAFATIVVWRDNGWEFISFDD